MSKCLFCGKEAGKWQDNPKGRDRKFCNDTCCLNYHATKYRMNHKRSLQVYSIARERLVERHYEEYQKILNKLKKERRKS